MLKLHMLPAGHGDCLWIEYGNSKRPRHVLIDGGVKATYEDYLKPRIAALPEDQRHLELFVLSHIDADHIEGALELIGDLERGVSFGDIWFNGWQHLPQEFLSVEQGIEFSAHIEEQGLPWNETFDGGAVMIDETDDPLPAVELEGGLKLTLVSPTRESLGRLRPAWNKALKEAGLLEEYEREFLSADEEGDPSDSLDLEDLAQSRFKKDGSKPNGSSIGLLLEWKERRILLSGDAHAPVLLDTLGWLLDERDEEILVIDALKLPHHGSGKNVDNKLLDIIDCPQYLISTNGERFHHPDHTALARVIMNGGEAPELVFNYRSEDNEVWDRDDLKDSYGYRVRYPEDGSEGITIEYE